MRQQDHPVADYVVSGSYAADLDATRRVWTTDRVLGAAGLFVFLSYLVSPALTGVRRGSQPRVIIDIRNEQLFLAGLFGVDKPGTKGLAGGIANPRLAEAAHQLRHAHLALTGMRQRYIDDMATIIAVAPLRVIALDPANELPDGTVACYWRYATHALSLLGGHLPARARADGHYESFAAGSAVTSPPADASIGFLRSAYPDHFDRALRAVAEPVRHAVQAALNQHP